jgi:hypothetical protein
MPIFEKWRNRTKKIGNNNINLWLDKTYLNKNITNE